MQPERDVRVKRAQRGQITWGAVDLDAEVPVDLRHLCVLALRQVAPRWVELLVERGDRPDVTHRATLLDHHALVRVLPMETEEPGVERVVI